MVDDGSERENDSADKPYFDWNAFMRFLLNNSTNRESIGAAWFLFFDIATHADSSGFYASTYSSLAKKYGVAVITVKSWRQYLKKHLVIESYSRGHSVAFKLLDPYTAFLKLKKPDSSNEPGADNEKALQLITKMIAKSLNPELLSSVKDI